jgi:hypothetical protein
MLRLAIGNIGTKPADVQEAWSLITSAVERPL